jgi:t-SNARE complex subunit (syntaxin)
MSVGFSELEQELKGTRDDVLGKVEQLLIQRDPILQKSHQQLLLGQEDISASLAHLSKDIQSVRSERKDILVERMTQLLKEHKDATQVLAYLFSGHSQAQSAQIQILVRYASNE